MTEDTAVAHRPRSRRRPVPDVVAPSSRVNVALPFSTFHMEEATRELVELAAVVAEMAVVIEEAAPGPQARALRERAEALRLRLR